MLVPSDVFCSRRPDEHFAAEADAARDAGLDVALVDHDALTRTDDARHAVARVPGGGTALYRGWMLTSAQYAAFDAALANRDVTLRTTPEQYRTAHELPGWYPMLADLTPASTWTAGDKVSDFERARQELGPGPAVLRDYTKSMKHYWHEAMFVADLGDARAAWRVACRLRELREDDFAGGFVLRRFEQFHAAEVRTWWVNGVCVLISPHPDTPQDEAPTDLDLTGVQPTVSALRLPFVTVDLALRTDGVWRIVEIGDGQVSDRPVTTRPEALITALRIDSPAR